MGNKGASSGKASGGGAGAKTSYKDVKFDEPEIDAGKPTTYSRTIFNNNYREARRYAVDNDGEFSFNNLYQNDTDPLMKAPTLKGVQALINTEKKTIELDVKFNILTPEQATTRMRALSAVQRTLNNTVINSRDYVQGLKKKSSKTQQGQ